MLSENLPNSLVALSLSNALPMDPQVRAVLEAKREASVKFSNMSRRMQDEAYQEVTNKEERERVRADYLRHPLKTWRRERRNKRMRDRQA